MLILKGCPPLYQQLRLVGPVLNQDLGMERHKEEALTSGCSPELMKNAKFQPSTGTDSGPGEQQALWNDTEVPTLWSYQWEGNELGRGGASAMQTLCPLPGRQEHFSCN